MIYSRKTWVFVLVLVGTSIVVIGQNEKQFITTPPVACFHDPTNKNTRVEPPAKFLEALKNPLTGTNKAVIDVEFSADFPQVARTPFLYAMDIWASIINATVKIKVKALWVDGESKNLLGYCGPSKYVMNFPSAQKRNTYYPIALAEHIAAKNINDPQDSDIICKIVKNGNWYFGTDGKPNDEETDFVSIVLHQIGHGLGCSSFFYNNDKGAGTVGSGGIPDIYDLQLENGRGQNLVHTYLNETTDLANEFLSENLFYKCQDQVKMKIFAPKEYKSRFSLSHLDEDTYLLGNINSLMTPYLASKEAIHNVGPLVESMFSDMGWVSTRIIHTPTSVETLIGNRLLAKIVSDNGYDPTTVSLTYAKKNQPQTETTITGRATAISNQYSFPLPDMAEFDTLVYYFSVKDNANRKFTAPGKNVKFRNMDVQAKYTMGFGQDNKAPLVSHTVNGALFKSMATLSIEANISDTMGIQEVFLDYWINNVMQPSLPLTVSTKNNNYDLVDKVSWDYEISIPVATNNLIKEGDVIAYQIRAIDKSLNNNVGIAPTASTKYTVNVIKINSVENNYQNNFNNLSAADFYEDQGNFTIIKENGFNDGAVHSIHPYVAAGKVNKTELSYYYYLLTPIKIQNENSKIKFDEIVLVEPGDMNSKFGESNFHDYVIVEGSTDGGQNWYPFEDGYNSGDYTPWVEMFTNSFVQNESVALGNPSLYRTRTIDMTLRFKVGDDVLIRFRLYSDSYTSGWGWAIDNLKIQIDDSPPSLEHEHLDYWSVDEVTTLDVNAVDFSGLASLAIEVRLSDGTMMSFPLQVSNIKNEINRKTLTLIGLNQGEDFEYRIKSIDQPGNEIILPDANTFFKVSYKTFNKPAEQYVSNFDSSNSDFIGNFFSLTKPTGFTNAAIHTTHPYTNGFGVKNQSTYRYMLKTPIIVSEYNPIIYFTEILIAEKNESATVQASADNGKTWIDLVEAYKSSLYPDWITAYNLSKNGEPKWYKSRIIDIRKSGVFNPGSTILIRFKFSVDWTNNAWGWAIDDLNVQGPITDIEKSVVESNFQVYPNPVNDSKVVVKFNTLDESNVELCFLNAQGGVQQTRITTPLAKLVEEEVLIQNWPAGVYIIKAKVGGNIVVKKFVKLN